jgi:Secretion system C-terminal sorting domain
MKQHYTFNGRLCLLILMCLISSSSISAQCLCTGGITPDSVVNYVHLDTTNAPSSVITFPQFDPSIGNLNCVNFKDTISGITTTGARNKSATKTQYKFLLTVANDISGPGMNVNESYSKIYGPDSLDAYGLPTDTITYGPDTLFRNVADNRNTSSVTPYTGLGTVNFVYTLNGGVTSLQGGLNYTSEISTRYWGGFRLAYYYCPLAVLANSITSFTVGKRDGLVNLNWKTVNENKIHLYVVEYSMDGKVFKEATRVTAGSEEVGDYKWNFPLSANQTSGKVYFRIKQLDANGKANYSAVRIVSLDDKAAMQMSTYPNPATNSVSLSFDRMINGNFRVELVNMAGQVVHTESAKMNHSNALTINWAKKPAAGVYFLRVTNTADLQQQLVRMVIQ